VTSPDQGTKATHQRPERKGDNVPKRGDSVTRSSAGNSEVDDGFEYVVSVLEIESGYESVPSDSKGSRRVRCPVHDDEVPSLNVSRGDSGRVLLHCHSGRCSQDDLVSTVLGLGVSRRELSGSGEFKPRQVDRSGLKKEPYPPDVANDWPEVARYDYTDAKGRVLYSKVRLEPSEQPEGDKRVKTFRVRGMEADTRRVLYRLPDVRRAVKEGQPVWVVEGEKDAEALRQLGEVATCNHDGAVRDPAKWPAAYTRHLRGADVHIVRDRDEAGHEHAANLVRLLAGAVHKVTVWDPATPQPHADVSDHLDAGYRLDQLVPVEIEPEAAAGTPGRFTPLNWADVFTAQADRTDWLCGRLVARGQQASLIGDGKAGKSLLMHELIWRSINGRGYLGDEPRTPMKVVYLDRENTKRDLFSRLTGFGATTADIPLLTKQFEYHSFPAFSGTLDGSATAAAELIELVENARADLVVLDTASRFIEGGENDSDTWLALYRRVHAELKARDIACIRLDHFGKDKGRGGRGSSAKTQDVDAVWELQVQDTTRTHQSDETWLYSTTLELKRTHTRSGEGPDSFLLVRRARKDADDNRWLSGTTATELCDPDQAKQQQQAESDDQLRRTVLALIQTHEEAKPGEKLSSNQIVDGVGARAQTVRQMLKAMASEDPPLLAVKPGQVALTDAGRDVLAEVE
jgi:5S rRNA maturation endonuclease (ribonuclease M5)